MHPAIVKCRARLRDKYRHQKNACFYPLPQRNSPMVNVRDMYVQCSVAEPGYLETYSSSSEKANSKAAVFLNLGENVRGNVLNILHVFKPREIPGGHKTDVTTVALTGPPGSGKTLAATRKLPLEWADEKWLPEVDLLFVITLRSLRGRLWTGDGSKKIPSTSITLSDTLGLGKLGLTEEEITEVLEYIKANSQDEKVLFVVDGLDEVHLVKEHLLHQLVCHELSDQVGAYRLLITARPCPAINWLLDEHCVDRSVVLSGFNEESREEFFSRYGKLLWNDRWVNEFKGKLDSLLRTFREFPHFSSHKTSGVDGLTFLPFIAVLLVHSIPVITSENLPKSKVHLLCYLLSSLLLGGRRLVPSVPPACSVFKFLEQGVVQELKTLACIAYDATTEGKFVFNECLLKAFDESGEKSSAAVVRDCLTFPFEDASYLVEGRMDKRQFIHLCVQELLTAYHMLSFALSNDVSKFEQLLSKFRSATNNGSQFTEVIRYMAGLVPACHAVRFFRCLACSPSWKGETVAQTDNMWEWSEEWYLTQKPVLANHCNVVSSVFSSLVKFYCGFLPLNSRCDLWVKVFTCTPGLITKLSFPMGSMDYTTLKALCTYQQNIQYLHILLPALDTNPDTMPLLCDFIAKSKRLNELHFALGSAGSTGSRRVSYVESLCSALERNMSITKSIFHGLHLNPNVMSYIAQFVARFQCCNISYQPGDLKTVFEALTGTRSSVLTDITIHVSYISSFDQSITLVDHICKFMVENSAVKSLNIFKDRSPIGKFLGRVTSSSSFKRILEMCATVRQHKRLEQFTVDCDLFGLDNSELTDVLRELVGKKSSNGSEIATRCVRKLYIVLGVAPSAVQCREYRKLVEEEICEGDDCLITFVLHDWSHGYLEKNTRLQIQHISSFQENPGDVVYQLVVNLDRSIWEVNDTEEEVVSRDTNVSLQAAQTDGMATRSVPSPKDDHQLRDSALNLASSAGPQDGAKSMPPLEIESKALRDIKDMYEFGELMRKRFSPKDREDLAREIVKYRDPDNVNNFKQNLCDFIRDHDKGKDKSINNFGGLLSYLAADERATCADLLKLVGSSCSYHVDFVRALIQKTAFSQAHKKLRV